MMDDEIVGIGIGCHSIGYFLHPDKLTNFSQMGGEGGHWIGRSPFSTKKHSFQNIGVLMLTLDHSLLEQQFQQELI